MRLGLGTVQFGLPYGATNCAGRVSDGDARAILECAATHGVRLLDTAAAYGTSEETLGRSMSANADFDIVTKTTSWEAEQDPQAALGLIRQQFERSLELLGRRDVYGLLVHQAQDLLGPAGDRLFACLQELQSMGRVEKLGASVYTPDEVIRLLSRYPLDIVQLPLNVFDQRMVLSGALNLLRGKGVEVHARSVFLQGVLLAQPGTPHGAPAELAPNVKNYLEFVRAAGLTPIQGCLAFVRQQGVHAAIVGVTSVDEFAEIVEAYDDVAACDLHWDSLSVENAQLIDPRNWHR